MKPLFKITLLSRDPMDPSAIVTAGIVEVTAIGDITINLTRDEMGVIKMEESEVSPEPGYLEQQKEAMMTFKELHEQLARTQLAVTHANIDLFAMHKWFTR